METNIEIEKLSAYAKTLQRTADHLLDNLERQMLQDAEDMAGRQRSNCPEDTGLLRESWTAYIPGYGFRRLKGRLPALFMYNGMQEMQPVIAEHYGTAIQEAIK